MLTVVSFVWMGLEYHTRRKEKTMSKKVSTYFPNYQLRRGTDPVRPKEIWFQHAGIYFTTKMSLFGATETQKVALRWAAYSTPPVICVKHEAPVAPDRKGFSDPSELHRTYYPYAMAIATLECLGEETPRKIKIYFCDMELHEENAFAHTHLRSKGTYTVPVM
ncbi:MAG: hypothetical protein Q8R13_01610 [bacterium]|nr:hypothetical protein [bacterium]MDZ4296164.1 hypothetical protein [Patescibacteria group bacterium]